MPLITHQDATLPAVTHDIMLRALRGERTSHVPVWAMRQAGRYLPEFRALRQKAEFFEVCDT
jgi:uroporphyrinogen decarboxylase